jgi:hypothetical protein
MARDYLAVPATGVGVERAFNIARDICGYRRSRLRPESIRASMMLKMHDNIELESEMEDLKSEDPYIDLKYDEEELDDVEDIKYISDDDIEEDLDALPSEEYVYNSDSHRDFDEAGRFNDDDDDDLYGASPTINHQRDYDSQAVSPPPPRSVSPLRRHYMDVLTGSEDEFYEPPNRADSEDSRDGNDLDDRSSDILPGRRSTGQSRFNNLNRGTGSQDVDDDFYGTQVDLTTQRSTQNFDMYDVPSTPPRPQQRAVKRPLPAVFIDDNLSVVSSDPLQMSTQPGISALSGNILKRRKIDQMQKASSQQVLPTAKTYAKATGKITMSQTIPKV